MPPLEIDPDIRRAQTLPSEVYHQARWYEHMRERLFPRTWHAHPGPLPDPEPDALRPWNLLAGCLDEPLLLTCDRSGLHLISNVCTHRGAILVSRPGQAPSLRCGYHGRTFALDGRMLAMPHAEGAEGFPRPCDDLATVPWARWHRLLFASLRPAHPHPELLAPLHRLSYLPLDRLEAVPLRSRDYHVAASWALYCDNALEHLHVPAVHSVPDDEAARPQTHLLPWGVLQLSPASGDAPRFSPPPGHLDHGRAIAGYHFWLFPCTMIDAYPWGLVVRVVLPLGAEHTRIVHLVYPWEPAGYDAETEAAFDQVEHEDEQMIESVARGVRSRLYDRGRYCPTREQGVHHFHRLLARALDEPDEPTAR